MKKLLLTEINIYPVKSLGGISLTTAGVEERGLKYDRRFMVVDVNGNFLTQRSHKEMVFLKVKMNESGYTLFNSKNLFGSINIPLNMADGKKTNVVVWDDNCEAIVADEKINMWLSKAMGVGCMLVYMPQSTKRIVQPGYGVENIAVSFADGYPFLIVGQASLDDLNTRLHLPLPMNRFRPNFVFDGGKAFDEDIWNEFLIGDVKFKRIKPCARCVISTTDQQTGERNEEPLATLSTYRKANNKVMFGQNLISLSTGIVKIGDEIKLL